jgi:hypothetical protein
MEGFATDGRAGLTGDLHELDGLLGCVHDELSCGAAVEGSEEYLCGHLMY